MAPRLLPSRSDSARAAARTSSSMVMVVRTMDPSRLTSRITHHTSREDAASPDTDGCAGRGAMTTPRSETAANRCEVHFDGDWQGCDPPGMQEGDVIRPKVVSRMGAQATQHRKPSARLARCIWVTGTADDAQQTVLRDGTGGPASMPDARKPCMRRFMLDVCRIHQSDQHVHVQQTVACHGDPSRSRFTNFSVTGRLSSPAGRSGGPFRIEPAPVCGRSDARARAEIMTTRLRSSRSESAQVVWRDDPAALYCARPEKDAHFFRCASRQTRRHPMVQKKSIQSMRLRCRGGDLGHGLR